MPPVFDSNTPVVDFGATSSPFKRESHRWLVWPALAYKVLLPSRGNPPFNVFQRAVLDMCRAGVRDTAEIAHRLALPLDLIVFVLEQLLNTEMLDEAHIPTNRALNLMSEDNEAGEVEESGYIFVDGFDGKRVWPRVHRGGLPIVDAEFEKSKGIAKFKFQRGNTGNPERVVATMVPSQNPAQYLVPSTYEAQKAARHHARRVQAFRREDSGRGGIGKALDGLKSSGLRVVDIGPQPVFVASYVFLPKDARHRSWLITDPLGLGVSNVLRPCVTMLAKEKRYGIDKLIEKVTNQAWRIDEEDFALYLAEATKASMERVKRHLGDAAQLLPADVVTRLADADVRLDGAKNAKQIEDFLGNAYSALESLFDWMVSLFPDPSLSKVLGQTPAENAQLLQRIAQQFGFTASSSTLPLLSVTRNVVVGALRNGNPTLPGRLAVALLAAQLNRNHPIATLGAREPDALEFFAEIGRLRNSASHDTSAVPTIEIAVKMRDRLFTVLRAVVGTGPVDVDADTSQISWGADLMLRVRARAEFACGTYPELAERPNVHTRVIEMHQAALCVKLLAASKDTARDTLNTRVRDAVVALSTAMEASFAEFEKTAPTPVSVAKTVSEDKEQNATQLLSAARTCGFDLDPSGKLPTALTHAQPNRIRRVAQGQPETLSACVAAQLLAASHQPKHPLCEVAKHCPSLLLDVSRIVKARGHADNVVVTAAEVAELETMVAKNIRAMLEIID
jgi:hypothetical protein